MNHFEYNARTRVIYGENTIGRLGELAREYGGSRVLLVTDGGIVRAGHAARAQESLSKAGLAVFLFDRVQENPTTRHVAECTQFARDNRIDLIVGLGGGSSMDTAKGTNFILTNSGEMAQYWGFNKATQPMLPLIAVPTTAGTGSECQCYALIADEKTHQKMACGDDKAYPKAAILDPTLTLSMPFAVTANTGIDTIAHALETCVTRPRTPVSQLFSRESWRLAESSLEVVLREPSHVEARGKMLLASAFGGMAIAQSMLGAAHSAANPLTAHFNIIHGQAVGIMLPHVVRFNSGDAQAAENYAVLTNAKDARSGCAALIDRLHDLLESAKVPRNLECFKIPAETIPVLAAEAAKQWTAQFNPRPLQVADFEMLYRSALKG